MSLNDRINGANDGNSPPQPPDGGATESPDAVKETLRYAVAGRSAEAALADRLESAGAVFERLPGLHNRDPYADLKTRIHRAVIDKLGARLFGVGTGEDLTEWVEQAVEKELRSDTTPLTGGERTRIIKEIVDDIMGYGPLEPLLSDDSVTEVMVNGYDSIYIERGGRIQAAETSFLDNAHLLRIIEKIVSQVGRRIDEASPMVDARLPDGSRVNAIIPPLSLRGPAVTIRKFSRDPYTIHDLVRFGTVSEKASEFLTACVRGKMNVLISGGTGTGKTTMLNAMSAFIPNKERIITIEDAAELQLQQEHVVTLEARPPNIEGKGGIPIRELVRNALRMRPDRIVVGEVRGAETLDMLQAMNTGHEGSLTTVHANSPRDALSRIETLVLTAGVELPIRAIREQLSSAFDLIVHLARLVDGSRRVSHITEVLRMESDVITLQDIFLARPPGENEVDTGPVALLKPLAYSGLKPHFLEKLATSDAQLPPGFFAEPEAPTRWTAGSVR
jgi:pilus assembly protein CpaF